VLGEISKHLLIIEVGKTPVKVFLIRGGNHPRLVRSGEARARAPIGRADMARPLAATMSHVQRETIKWFLASLTHLAEQYQCVIVYIRHPSKPEQGEGKVIHRSLIYADLY
jgi:hypothetical protein